MLALVELTDWTDKPVQMLSSGMKRRLEIARALIHDAEILLLDEPTVGLDAQSRDRIWSYIRRLGIERQITVLVTTHYIEEVEGCDRACIVDHGKVLALGTPAALKQTYGQQILRIAPRSEEDRREILSRFADRVVSEAHDAILLASDDTLAETLFADFGGRVLSLSVERPSLADSVSVFDWPRNSRPSRRCPRAHLRIRKAWRGAHEMTSGETADIEPTSGRPSILVELGGLYGLWLREVKRSMRDRGQLIGGISRPILWVLILGIGLNPYFRGEVYGEVNFVVPFTYLQFIFPAVVALNIMYTSVQSAVSVIWDREFGFLREVLVSPMSRGSVLLGKVLGGATVAVIHGCLVLLLARFADVPLTWLDVLKALGPDGHACLRADLAGRCDRQSGPQFRGLWRLLERGHPSAVLYVQFDLSPRSGLDAGADPRRLPRMAGHPRSVQSADICGGRAARRID